MQGGLFIGPGVSSVSSFPAEEGLRAHPSNPSQKLSGGALGKNIFYQVSGGATVDVGGQLDGVVGSKTTVILNTGATLRGRALAQTAVRLDRSYHRPRARTDFDSQKVTLQKAVLTPPAEAPCSLVGCITTLTA